MTRDSFIDRADFVEQWKAMIEKPLAGEQQVKPPRLTAPRLNDAQGESGEEIVYDERQTGSVT